MGKLIDARAVFPHAVLPLAICAECGRRLTIVMPANAELSEVKCPCGTVGNFVEPV